MTDDEFRKKFDSVAELVSAVAARTDQRIDGLRENMEKRFDTLASRLERMENMLIINGVAMQTVGFNKSLADHA
jgi:hypothetical protein